MNLPPGMWEAVLRALVLAGFLAGIAPSIRALLVAQPWWWGVVALPVVTPSVVIGHAYVGWSPGAPGSMGVEIWYATLVAAKLLPIAAILQFLLPPAPLSPRARHGLKLAEVMRFSDRRFGPLRNRIVVGGIVFVLAFQEFELASLFYGIRSWTVAVFDAQAGGMALSVTLTQAIGPIAVELAVLGVVMTVFLATRVPGRGPVEPPRVGRSGRVWVVSAAVLTAVLPGALLVPGIGSVVAQGHMITDIRHSVVLAGGAMVGATVIAATCPLPVLLGLCVPGLSGALILALATQALFQTGLLAPAYDTPMPLLVAWILLLLPLAVMLRLASDRWTAQRGLHLARLLGDSPVSSQRRAGRGLEFRLRGLPLGLGVALLFVIAFFEVVAADLLAPGGMTPAAPRLYNLMHYGRSPGLAAMVLLMAGAAILCAGTGLGLWRMLAGVWRRPAGDREPSQPWSNEP